MLKWTSYRARYHFTKICSIKCTRRTYWINLDHDVSWSWHLLTSSLYSGQFSLSSLTDITKLLILTSVKNLKQWTTRADTDSMDVSGHVRTRNAAPWHQWPEAMPVSLMLSQWSDQNRKVPTVTSLAAKKQRKSRDIQVTNKWIEENTRPGVDKVKL